MEPEPGNKSHAGSSSKSASSSYGDLDVMEVSSLAGAASCSYSQQKRKRSQVVGHDVIEIDDDNEDDPATVISKSTSIDKSKQVMEGEQYSHKYMEMEDNFADDLGGPSTYYALEVDKSLEDSENIEAEDDNDDLDLLEDYGYAFEDGYEDYVFGGGISEKESDYNLAAKFDNLDLPPGVEATVPLWLRLSSETTSNRKVAADVHEIDKRYNNFKKFDVVQDYSDHHYSKPENIKSNLLAKKPSKDWTKRIQHEWKILEKDLPETILVRAYEERMDLLRAVIVGPAGTPYHDGLFFFDCFFPSNYPDIAPLVHYHSGGLRLNPNLYACGKVCLSLLGTWGGNGCEKWKAGKSTMLQVLVSIQALVLNAKPYFNEPGYEASANTDAGEKMSLAYNEDTFLLSCNTMIYSLRRPPKNFEDLVVGHFRKYGGAILLACRAYMDGAQVGCVVGDGVRAIDEGDKFSSSPFRNKLKKLFEELLMEFTVKGADCDMFLAQKVKAGLTKGKETFAPDTTLRL